MNNKIVYAAKSEIEKIKECVINNKDIFYAEIDGSEIATEEEYVRKMSQAFEFPCELPELKIGWYNDYINDLMWIKQKEIVMVIYNYDLMLSEYLIIKNNIIKDFEEIILPWWEGEIVGHMVGGTPKKFMIYIEIGEKDAVKT